MHTKRIAIAAFLIGLPALLVAPFAIICGGAYILESVGLIKEPDGVPFDWGFGGVLYCLGIPVWLGYLWAAGSRRSSESLKNFWLISFGLNVICTIFFLVTTLKPERLSSPTAIWVVYAILPGVLLFVSYLGYLAASANART